MATHRGEFGRVCTLIDTIIHLLLIAACKTGSPED
jgi:hypothetical protein